MSTMTITIERTPRTVQLGDTALQVEELSITLPFARKPVNLKELGGGSFEKVLVTETRTMDPGEFDLFAASPCPRALGSRARAAPPKRVLFASRFAHRVAPTSTSTQKVQTSVATLRGWVKDSKEKPN